MPFDAVGTTTTTLHDTALRLGLQPIPLAELEAYKADQVAKHPANWVHRHLRLFLLSLLGLWLAAVVLAEVFVPTFGFVGAFAPLTMIMMFRYVPWLRDRSEAVWSEKRGSSYMVPPGIAENMHRLILRHHAHCYPLVGVLYQRDVVLDPYLIVQSVEGDRVCLGIWDDTGIIRQA